MHDIHEANVRRDQFALFTLGECDIEAVVDANPPLGREFDGTW